MWVFGYRVGRLRAHQAHSTLHTHLDTLNQALHYIFDAPHSTLSAPLFQIDTLNFTRPMLNSPSEAPHLIIRCSTFHSSTLQSSTLQLYTSPPKIYTPQLHSPQFHIPKLHTVRLPRPSSTLQSPILHNLHSIAHTHQIVSDDRNLFGKLHTSHFTATYSTVPNSTAPHPKFQTYSFKF